MCTKGQSGINVRQCCLESQKIAPLERGNFCVQLTCCFAKSRKNSVEKHREPVLLTGKKEKLKILKMHVKYITSSP